MASLDQENMYAPKRAVDGKFADNPRIMGHDSVDIFKLGLNNQIPGTGSPNRGAALYCGKDFTSIEVVLEGQAKTNVSGDPISTTVFRGISAGSFLPILAVQVQATTPSLGNDGELVALL